jgi:glycopeptide antibiotics resistance protein
MKEIMKILWILPVLAILNFIFVVDGIFKVCDGNFSGFFGIFLNGAGAAAAWVIFVYFRVKRKEKENQKIEEWNQD